jgi:hypothetical protein
LFTIGEKMVIVSENKGIEARNNCNVQLIKEPGHP